jgi:HK97 family phage major capsid protein
MEDKRSELKGLLKELVTDEIGSKIDDLTAKAEAADEANTKILESNKELKTQFDTMQDKAFKLAQNTGEASYIFKGYDTTRPTRNFKIACSKEAGDEAAGIILKALTSANTGAYAIPTEYSSALLGLAELQSYALSRCRIVRYPGEVLKMPGKGTRATVDVQAVGTANAAAATTLAQLTFTIDKRIGGYETIYNNVLRQANFDVVGEMVEPMLAEAIGQNIDTEMFEKTEFTTDILAGGTEGATFSGTIGSSSITYAKLMDVEFAVEQERGVNPEWCMSRGVFKYVAKLVDDQSHPIFNRDLTGATPYMIDGYPVHIVPAIPSSPGDGKMALAFGDPKRYIIAMNQDVIFEVNPYVEQKEGKTQFIMHATCDGNIEAATCWAYYKRSD